MKKRTLHTVVWKEEKLYVAKFLELELASQGKTRASALKNLQEALELYLEDEPTGGLKLPKIGEVSTNTISL